MAKTPLECQSSGQEPDANINDSARVNCAGKTRRQFLSLCTIAVLAGVLGISDKAEAKNQSSVSPENMDLSDFALMNRAPLTWKQLIKMSYAELEKKLSAMDEYEVQKILQSLLPVVDEVDRIANDDIEKKLRCKNQLDESEKTFFLKLAAKYRPESLSVIQDKFKKEQLTNSDFEYLFIEFKHYVKCQRDIVVVLSIVRSLAIKRGCLETNAEKEKEYMELQKGLQKFMDSLDNY